MHYEQSHYDGKEIVVVSEDIHSVIAQDWIDYYLSKHKVPGLVQFDRDFEIYDTAGYMVQPYDSYGATLCDVIRRRSDGKNFGFSYYQGGGKYGESYYDCNGSEFGYDEVENPLYQKSAGDEEFNHEYIYYYVFQEMVEDTIPAWRFA